MLNKKNLIALIALVFGILNIASAQKISKNALYGNFGGAYQMGAGLHYERILLGGKNLHLGLNAGLGYSFNKSTQTLPGGTYLPIQLNAAAGFKGHFLEIAAGPTAYIENIKIEGMKPSAKMSLVGGQLQVGYKFISKHQPGLFLKVYGTGIFMSSTPGTSLDNVDDWFKGTIKAKMLPSAGVSIGMSF